MLNEEPKSVHSIMTKVSLNDPLIHPQQSGSVGIMGANVCIQKTSWLVGNCEAMTLFLLKQHVTDDDILLGPHGSQVSTCLYCILDVLAVVSKFPHFWYARKWKTGHKLSRKTLPPFHRPGCFRVYKLASVQPSFFLFLLQSMGYSRYPLERELTQQNVLRPSFSSTGTLSGSDTSQHLSNEDQWEDTDIHRRFLAARYSTFVNNAI